MLMNHKVGSNFVIPPAMLQSSMTISVVLLMPLYDKMFIPLVRLITREEKGITELQRIRIGMILSVIAMAFAAIVESRRLDIVSKGDATQLSIFWLLPQYILPGIADAFTVVGNARVLLHTGPSTMRTTGIALYLSVWFWKYLGAFLITVLGTAMVRTDKGRGWFYDDAQQEHLD